MLSLQLIFALAFLNACMITESIADPMKSSTMNNVQLAAEVEKTADAKRIILHIKLTNNGEKPVYWAWANDVREFHIAVRDQDGKSPALTHEGDIILNNQSIGNEMGNIPNMDLSHKNNYLDPNGSREWNIEISSLYTITSGNHVLDISMHVIVQSSPEVPLNVGIKDVPFSLP